MRAKSLGAVSPSSVRVLRLRRGSPCVVADAFRAAEHLASLERISVCVERCSGVCPFTGVTRIKYYSLIASTPSIRAKSSQLSEDESLYPWAPPFGSTEAADLISVGKDAIV